MDKKTEHDDLKLLDELFLEVGTYRQSKDLKELLRFIKRFPRLAPFNAALLHIQKPGSSFVATIREWREKFGRTIKPGARPLVILWPFAPVRFVFELEDTTGTDFPRELLQPFQTNGRLPEHAFSRLVGNLSRDGISYHEADHGTSSAGYIQIAPFESIQVVKSKPSKVYYNLVVNRNHSAEEKFATIAHELGHLYCGHLGTPNESWWPARGHLPKTVREFEAECVSWIVCSRMGLRTPSAEYLHGYLEANEKIPEISLENVLRAAGQIESMAQRSLSLRKEVVSTAPHFSAQNLPFLHD